MFQPNMPAVAIAYAITNWYLADDQEFPSFEARDEKNESGIRLTYDFCGLFLSEFSGCLTTAYVETFNTKIPKFKI